MVDLCRRKQFNPLSSALLALRNEPSCHGGTPWPLVGRSGLELVALGCDHPSGSVDGWDAFCLFLILTSASQSCITACSPASDFALHFSPSNFESAEVTSLAFCTLIVDAMTRYLLSSLVLLFVGFGGSPSVRGQSPTDPDTNGLPPCGVSWYSIIEIIQTNFLLPLNSHSIFPSCAHLSLYFFF